MGSFNAEGYFILQHLLELLVLDFPIPGVVHRPDQFLDVDGQVELLLDDAHQHLPVDVPGLVGGSSDGGVGVEGDLVVLPVDLALPLLAVDLQDLLELDEAGVVAVQL